MQKKSVLFIADTVDNAKKFSEVLKRFDIVLSTCRFDNAFETASKFSGIDLIICEIPEGGLTEEMRARAKIANLGVESVLLICPDSQIDSLRLPVHIKADFVAQSASVSECIVRTKNILYPGSETTQNDIIMQGNMTINLATYQVQVNDIPLDLTYLEYALLAFLVTHPRHSYSRDELLKRVWGFDYLGGSRTVDVHIRRIRSKIGPENANKLKTVRGVGYLWDS